MVKKNIVLLIYPPLGFAGSYVVHAPIGLLYVASEIIKDNRIEIEIFDCRIYNDWEQRLHDRLQKEKILLAGLSVMSGLPVYYAAKINSLVKAAGNTPVVWGGSHPTVLPEASLEIPGTDYCIRGFGSRPFASLVKNLLGDAIELKPVKGLCFFNGEETVINPIEDCFEDHDFRKLPYHLLDKTINHYFQGQKDRVFPIYTVWGCAYKCAFCISPVWYRNLNCKWVPFPAESIADHIEFLIAKYHVDFIYFIDDDTFVRPGHFRAIADELLRRKIKIRIGIRGMRVNEAYLLSDEDYSLLRAVGVRYLHIGIESGSQRMLKLMKKGITVEQTIEMNRKLARFPEIIPLYNFLCGIPGETIKDVRLTGRLMLQLTRDNPNCIMFHPGKFIPYPGTELYNLAVDNGFKPPVSPEEWKKMDQEEEVYHPWYTPCYNRNIQMLQVAAYALSNWGAFLKSYPVWLQLMYKIVKIIYFPVAVFRIRTGLSIFLLEYSVFNKLRKILS